MTTSVYVILCTLVVMLQELEEVASSTMQPAQCNNGHGHHTCCSATAGERCSVQALNSSSQALLGNYRKCDNPSLCTCPWTNYCRVSSSQMTAQSKPQNLSISAAPTGPGTFEVTALWDVDESDTTITGYEAYMHIYGEPVACACISNRHQHQLTFNFDARLYEGADIILEVITQPYISRSSNRAVLRYIYTREKFTYCEPFALKSNSQACRLRSIQASQVTATTELVLNDSRTEQSGNERSMMVNLSWSTQQGCCDNVLIALVDVNSRNDWSCSAPGRNPPCYVISNASSVTIGPLNTSVQYSANLYTFISGECNNVELSYVFVGCNGGCCGQGIAVPHPHSPPTDLIVNPTSVSATQSTSYYSTTVSVVPTVHTNIRVPPHSKLFSHSTSASTSFFPKFYLTSHALGKTTTHIHSIHLESHQDSIWQTLNTHLLPSALPSIRDGHPPNSKASTTDRTTVVFSVVGVVGGVVIIVVVMALLGVMYAKKYRQKHSHNHGDIEPQNETLNQHHNNHNGDQHRNGTPRQNGLKHWNGLTSSRNKSGMTREDKSYCFQDESSHSRSSCEEDSICITLTHSGGAPLPPLEVGSPASDMTSKCENLLSLSPIHSKTPQAVIVYSPNSKEKDRRLILQLLVSDLKDYGVETKSHDITCIRESPSQWLEREIDQADAVLCVCNREFKQDWENFSSHSQYLPLISSLKHIVHATVNQGKSLSKYATVLLCQRDKDCVPTLYLQGDPRQFLVNDVEDIARFVQNIPSYSSS